MLAESTTTNWRRQYGGLKEYTAGTMELNSGLSAPFWEVVGCELQ